MTREITFTEPVVTTQFSVHQLRPRALAGLMLGGFARWMDAHVVSFPQLIDEYNSAVVIRSLLIDYQRPDLRFTEAAWLTIRVRMRVSTDADWLLVGLDYLAGERLAARGRLVLRVVSVGGDESLAATPGVLPDTLRSLFKADEVHPFTGTSTFRDPMPPLMTEQALGAQEWLTPLFRSHCEVADQWSFIEMLELATLARERFFARDDSPPVARDAVRAPVRSVGAVFRRPMFVFDECRVVTSARRVEQNGHVVFLHQMDRSALRKTHLTVWEVLDTTPSRNTAHT